MFKLNTKNIWFDQVEPDYDPFDEVSLKKFKEYWKLEKERCISGFYLGDVHVSGWLYFHTVYWKIAMYQENDSGRKSRVIATPLLRDVDWDVSQDFLACEEQGLFYSLVGSRDWGKSIIGASRAGWLYTFFDNSESVISGGADNYIKLATDKIEDGLINIHPIWKKQRIANDWKKEVKAGWKDKNTNQIHPKSSSSRILMRNYENGNKSMAANGTRPGFHLIDEIGTISKLISCIKDSDGCWWSGGGSKPSCLVMVTGTGGDMEVGAEASEIFFNPEAYNMLPFENFEQPGKMGRFISALRSRMKFKDKRSLADYLNIDTPELRKIPILVSDQERAKTEWWDKEHAKAVKSGNPRTLIKFKAYWPLVPSDSFLVLKSNNYNIDAARNQQARLKAQAITGHGFIGTPIEIYHNGEKLTHRENWDRMPITEFPVKTQDTKAPIIMYEPPIESAPWGLYIAGVDPIRHDGEGESLGSVYIFKRMHDIHSEKFQDMFVASFTARYDRVDDWNEIARNLIKYYNALAFVENDEMSFIRYMQNKGDDNYLSDVPQWLRDQVPFSTAAANRDKGVHSSPKTILFYQSCLKNYLDEVIATEKDEAGSVIKEHLGVERVLDPMLLEEIVKFNKDGNFDRERAASICVAAANKMTPFGKVTSIDKDPRYTSLFNKKKPDNSVFKGGRSVFSNTSKIFR